jgi:hypothetical protein
LYDPGRMAPRPLMDGTRKPVLVAQSGQRHPPVQASNAQINSFKDQTHDR